MKLPHFDGIDRENILRIFHDEVVKFREESNFQFTVGEITTERHEWNLEHSKHIEELQNKITTILNQCPEPPDSQQKEE